MTMEMLSIKDLPLCSGREHALGSLEDYISTLCECKKTRNRANGNRLYMHFCRIGLETHRELGNYLIPLLAECGEWQQAHQLFHKLAHQNEFSYGALIQGCVESDYFDLAFDLFQDMQQHRVRPSKFTYIALLKACASVASLKRGLRIHHDVVQDALEQDAFVASAFIYMYTSCDLPSEAADVFEDVPTRDVPLWNSSIVAYADSASGKDPLVCLREMYSEGLSPDEVTYLCCLKASKCLDNVHALHTEILVEGYENEGFIGNALLGAYARYCSLSEALEVSGELTTRDAISWNVLIAGCLEQGLFSEALKYLKIMQQEGVPPDHVSYIHALKACTSLKVLDKSLDLHKEIVLEGLEKESFLVGTLIDTYSKLGALSEARDALFEMPTRTVVAWTALIGGFTEHDQPEEALQLLETMRFERISPNCSTMICCLQACGNAGNIDMGLRLHGEIVKKGYEVDSFVSNALVDMYARCQSLEDSLSVFGALRHKDVVSWTSVITAYAEHGLAEEAVSCLNCMELEGVTPDVVAWNAVITCFGELEETDKSLQLCAQMQEQGLLPVVATFASILHGCSSKAALKHGKRIHSQILRLDRSEAVDASLGTDLIDMYSKCGSMVEAEQVFEVMPTRDLVACNALIAGYVRKGESARAFELFDRMVDDGIEPDETAFLSVLTLCTHAGLVKQGLDYFEAMVFKYGITPTNKHYNCLLDLLSRAGQLNEALLMFSRMPTIPDLAAWNTLLGACQKSGDIDLGQQAFEVSKGHDMPPAAGFVLMSNLYADTAA